MLRRKLKTRTPSTTNNKTKTKTKSKTKTTYTVDSIVYSSKDLADFHKMLVGNPVVNSFHLPSVQDEAKKTNIKYKAKECDINDNHFDSLMEAKYYVFLLEQKKFGFIKDFTMQTEFTLMDKYVNKFTGKTIRPIKYLADFVVTKSDGTKEAIDVKGQETDVFKIKEKLFGSKYPNIKLTCYQYSQKYGNRWVDLDELKELRKKDKSKKAKKK